MNFLVHRLILLRLPHQASMTWIGMWTLVWPIMWHLICPTSLFVMTTLVMTNSSSVMVNLYLFLLLVPLSSIPCASITFYMLHKFPKIFYLSLNLFEITSATFNFTLIILLSRTSKHIGSFCKDQLRMAYTISSYLIDADPSLKLFWLLQIPSLSDTID